MTTIWTKIEQPVTSPTILDDLRQAFAAGDLDREDFDLYTEHFSRKLRERVAATPSELVMARCIQDRDSAWDQLLFAMTAAELDSTEASELAAALTQRDGFPARPDWARGL